jgi:hypothetical protein
MILAPARECAVSVSVTIWKCGNCQGVVSPKMPKRPMTALSNILPASSRKKEYESNRNAKGLEAVEWPWAIGFIEN